MKFRDHLREVASLSRLLDVNLSVEVVPGDVTNIDNLQTLTVSIPTEDYLKLTGEDVETLYLRPMIKALAAKINTLGNVRAAAIPLERIPKSEQAHLCTKGRIPVLLRVVRRQIPTDRHQILIHALVQPETENNATA